MYFTVHRFFIRSTLAEREGFEPPEPRSSTVFKTAAIDHSATSPSAKVEQFFGSTKYFPRFFIACRGKRLIINQKYAVLFGRLGKKINFVFDNIPPTNPYNFDRYE